MDCSLTSQIIARSIYVDNVVHTGTSPASLIDFFTESRSIFKQGHFNLKAWASNCPELNDRASAANVLSDDVN